MPELLNTPILLSRLLSWDAPTRRFVAEVSDLPGFRTGQAYADAADEGITLQDPGLLQNRHPLVLEHVETSEGDVLWWDFTPILPRDARLFAGVRIFND